ncbi:MAG TPA: hypothetical protein VF625_11125 [Longimicrobium sp.]|jgi:AraC-like DNA-binding protein
MPRILNRSLPLYILASPRLAAYHVPYRTFRVLPIDNWTAAFEIARDASPDSLMLVDPYLDDAAAPSPELFRLLATYPALSVLVALDLTSERVGDVREMLGAGISGIVNLRVDTTPEIAARHFHDAVARPFKRRLEDLLSPYVAPDARTILNAAAEIAVLGGGAAELAASFDVTPKTLTGWCVEAGLPRTRQLQLWMRLLLATLLLEDRGRTLHKAAVAAGYAAERSLRRAAEQMLGTGPKMLREPGALEQVARGFNEELRKHRHGEVAARR